MERQTEAITCGVCRTLLVAPGLEGKAAQGARAAALAHVRGHVQDAGRGFRSGGWRRWLTGACTAA